MNISGLKRMLAGVALIVGLLHGAHDFDASRTVTVSGVIVESKYENPHCEAKLRVDGQVWFVELSAVWRMQRRGVTAEMIKPGTSVTLVGYPHRKKAREMKAKRMTVGGKTYELI